MSTRSVLACRPSRRPSSSSGNGRLPSFFGLFDLYGGAWSSQLDEPAFVGRLLGFGGVTVVVAGSAWLLWRRRRSGAVLNLALLPLEAVFWIGFALPLPWVAAVARVALVAAAWRSLGGGRPVGAAGSSV